MYFHCILTIQSCAILCVGQDTLDQHALTPGKDIYRTARAAKAYIN